jgi:SulP family sulfate permease
VITVYFDLIEAVEIGVTRAQLPGPAQAGDQRIALLRLDGPIFFVAAERISSTITDVDHPEVRVVIIRMSQLGMLDATGANTLAAIVTELESRGITVIIRGVQPEHLDLPTNVGVIDSLDEAITHARSHARAAIVRFPTQAWN